MKPVAILYAREDSIYKRMPGCDVYDADRNAYTFVGNHPVVAHPPCRLWGRLKQMSTASISEKGTAFHALTMVRKNGGVLEHPAWSTLWSAAGIPLKGEDRFGGFTISVPQWWFGHDAMKSTWLYVVGMKPKDVPPISLKLGTPLYTVATKSTSRATMRLRGLVGEMPKSKRDVTPPLFAEWLVDLARRTKV